MDRTVYAVNTAREGGRGRERERERISRVVYQISFWKKQDVHGLEGNYLEKLSIDMMYIFIYILFYFDTLSGCKDTNVRHYFQNVLCTVYFLPLVIACIAWFLGGFTKLWKADTSFIMSVHLSCPQGTTQLPLDGFSQNFIFECI
jgi:hypothetical protein